MRPRAALKGAYIIPIIAIFGFFFVVVVVLDLNFLVLFIEFYEAHRYM